MLDVVRRARSREGWARLAAACVLGLLLCCLLPASGVVGQDSSQDMDPAGGYTLTWWTVDGGGATYAGSGAYTLGATAGQPEAETVGAGPYTLSGGFWPGGSGRYRTYLPLIARATP